MRYLLCPTCQLRVRHDPEDKGFGVMVCQQGHTFHENDIIHENGANVIPPGYVWQVADDGFVILKNRDEELSFTDARGFVWYAGSFVSGDDGETYWAVHCDGEPRAPYWLAEDKSEALDMLQEMRRRHGVQP